MSEANDIEKDLRGVAKFIATCSEVYRFTLKYWYILSFFGLSIWGVAKTYYKMYAEPEIRNYIVVVAKDSLAPLVPGLIHAELDTILKKKGVSFRSGLSTETEVPKDSIVHIYSEIYKKEEGVYKAIDTLTFLSGYQSGFNHLLLKLTCNRVEYDGVPLWESEIGDYYYEDEYGLIWDANYKASDDCFYYFPPYKNNKRTKCVRR